jgi:hypothetical protein
VGTGAVGGRLRLGAGRPGAMRGGGIAHGLAGGGGDGRVARAGRHSRAGRVGACSAAPLKNARGGSAPMVGQAACQRVGGQSRSSKRDALVSRQKAPRPSWAGGGGRAGEWKGGRDGWDTDTLAVKVGLGLAGQRLGSQAAQAVAVCTAGWGAWGWGFGALRSLAHGCCKLEVKTMCCAAGRGQGHGWWASKTQCGLLGRHAVKAATRGSPSRSRRWAPTPGACRRPSCRRCCSCPWGWRPSHPRWRRCCCR